MRLIKAVCMALVITQISLSSKNVKVGEQYKIMVSVKEPLTEPKMYRLPFNLGTKKGGIK